MTNGAASDYLEQLVMKWLLRNTDMPGAPNTLYLALFKGGVLEDDVSGAIECSTGNYARLALSCGAAGTGVGAVFAAPGASSGESTNVANIDFPACADAAWAPAGDEVTAWGLFDAASGGNMLERGDVTPKARIEISDIFRFNAGQLSIKMG